MEKECKIHGLANHTISNGKIRCNKCSTAAVTKSRQTLKLKAIEYKGGKCEHCRTSFPPAVYDFHHRNPSEKDFSISVSGNCRAWEKVKVELDKCLMLCANCHRIEHANLRNSR